MDNTTQQGLAALRAGNKSLARTLFRKAIQINHDDTQAWLGLSASVESDFEKVQCLQTIMKIDPNNKIAKKALDQLVGRLFHGDNLNLDNPNLGSTIGPIPESIESPRPETSAVQTQGLTKPDNPPQKVKSDQPADKTNAPDPFEILRSRYATQDNPPETPAPTEREPSQPIPPQPVLPVKKSYLIEPEEKAPLGKSVEVIGVRPDDASKAKQENQSAKKNPYFRTILILGGVFALILFVGMMVVIGMVANGPRATPTPEFMGIAKPILASDLTQAANSPKLAFATSTLIPTETLSAIKTPIPSPTYPLPNRTIQARFKIIQTQVSNLRGLPIIQEDVPAYPITKPQAQEYFSHIVTASDFATQLENRKKALVLLGLVNSTFDMYSEVINHNVDNVGGFYTPDSQEIFIVTGLSGSGTDFMVYAHEFDHALVDQNYNIRNAGVYPVCKFDSQHCRAIEALFEGDAELLMEQWARQYVTQKDVLQALNSPQPFYEPDNQAIPPYLMQDALFPYNYGTQFVKAFYQTGNWASVNRLYGRLPISTTQIMHPDKYLGNAQPIDMPDKALGQRLGDGWAKIEDDSLGEWMTYLMLAYNADKNAQVDPKSAKVAAAGWDGDHYQVFENKASHAQALGAHWAFETSPDLGEFSNIMLLMLENRNRGNRMDWLGRDCWQVDGQMSCFFTWSKQALWLVGPDKDTLADMLSAYPDFQQK